MKKIFTNIHERLENLVYKIERNSNLEMVEAIFYAAIGVCAVSISALLVGSINLTNSGEVAATILFYGGCFFGVIASMRTMFIVAFELSRRVWRKTFSRKFQALVKG